MVSSRLILFGAVRSWALFLTFFLNKIVKPGQIAAISLTGLISAFAVALLLWPPPPKDVIHVPAMDKTRKADGPDYCRLDTKDLEVAKDPGKFKSVAVDNQFTLDQGLENVQRCLDFKNSASRGRGHRGQTAY